MAWSAPITWAVSQIVTAAQMNAGIRDNLNYLKGLAGGVAIEDMLTVGAATAPSASLHAIRSGAGAQEAIRLDNTTNAGSNGSKITWRNAAQAFDAGLIQAVRNGSGVDFLLQFGTTSDFSAVNAPVGMTLSSTGLGIGTAAPAGTLHAVGTQSGVIHWEHASVDATIRNVLPAPSVGFVATVVYAVRDSSGTTYGGIVNGMTTTAFLVNDGTNFLRLNITGGALEIQRTGGTRTYRVVLWVTYT